MEQDAGRPSWLPSRRTLPLYIFVCIALIILATSSEGARKVKSLPMLPPNITERCLIHGGAFMIPELRGVEKQRFFLQGASWFNVRHLFTRVVIHPSNPKQKMALMILEGHINDTHLKEVNIDTSIVQSFWSFVTGVEDERHRLGITSPYGAQSLVVWNDEPVPIECTREIDWVIVGMVFAGFFLSTMSGILGAYHATLLICGAILGMLIGIALPLFFLFNKQTKVFITAASAGLVSYGAVFCWRWLITSKYFWIYLCVSAIFGMWWFGNNGQGGKQVVSWSLWLLGMVLLGTATNHFDTINLFMLVVAFGLRVLIELGYPQRVLNEVGLNFYWHVWLKIYPQYKKMLTREEYQSQAKEATKDGLDQLRLYFFQYEDWRSLYKDNPEAIKRIETFLGNKDHLQLNFDNLKQL